MQKNLDVSHAIAAAREGEATELWDAVDGMRPYLKAVVAGILRQRLSGKVDPSDVVQQALLASVERFEQFRGASSAELQAWVIAVVRNEARNVLRYWHQDRRLVARERPVDTSRADGGDDKLRVSIPIGLSALPTPSRQLALRQEATSVLAALDRLPSEQREVIRLRNFDGLSHAAIAERMGRSEDAVRQLWVRALRRLREAMP